jgi:hypothetical protein
MEPLKKESIEEIQLLHQKESLELQTQEVTVDIESNKRMIKVNRKVCCSVVFLVVLATLVISWILWFVLLEVGI